MKPTSEDQALGVIIIATAIVAVVLLRKRRWRPSGTAFGTASWMSEKMLRAAGFLAGSGLIVGRTFKGVLIRIPDYVHVLLVGGTGSGKGVSIIIPNLLTYKRGSIVCFDTKGDLIKTAGLPRAAKGELIVDLAPFDGGASAFNPLDIIPRDSPTLIDDAKAVTEALVVRQGTEPDPHWSDKSVQIIHAVMVLVLLRFNDNERNLVSVLQIVSDPDLLRIASEKLQKIGGVPATLGSLLKTLFENQVDDK